MAHIWRISPDARTFASILNPERIGFVLQRIPGIHVRDFQDLRAGRRLNVAAGCAMGAVRGTVIVPMAFSEHAYLDEIRSGLVVTGRPVLHFSLVALLAAVQERLAMRGEPEHDIRRPWVHRCAAECCCPHADARFTVQVPAAGQSVRIAAVISAI